MEPAHFKVPADQLRWFCTPADLAFDCTDELNPPEGFIGQDRAVAALEFGLGVNQPGFNIFVTGLTGTGRTTVIKSHLEQVVRRRSKDFDSAPVYDWCYAYNFQQPEQPAAVRLPRGRGKQLQERTAELLESLRRDIRHAFRSDAYKEEMKRLTAAMVSQRQEMLKQTERFAVAKGFAIQMSPAGVSVIPIANGKPLEQAEYLAMDEAARGELDRRRREVSEQVEETVREIQRIEQEHLQAGRDLDRKVAERTVSMPFESMAAEFRDNDQVQTFLNGLRDHTLRHVKAFLASPDGDAEQESNPTPAPGPATPGQSRNPFLPFDVNLFVDNSQTVGPPILLEENPTYTNLFGQIERRPMLGTYVTDHTMLRAGSVERAGGGYLVIQAREVFRHPGVWEALKRMLKGGHVRPEDPSDSIFPALIPQGLRPEPIPIQVKVIMTGGAELYHLLSSLDEDFWNIFKVRADFDSQMDRTPEHISAYGSLLCGMIAQNGLLHFHRSGVAEVVEYGARLVQDKSKLSTRFGLIRDIVVEAAHWAEQDGATMVAREHVRKALEQRVYRSSLASDRIRELMVRGVLMVDLEGSEVGQVNGLAVYNLGDVAFGKPSRITAATYMGKAGVVNIEREARLSGSTHDKGVLILSGYLARRFAQKHPLSVGISIAFEQSYSGVDGDSASSTELYAILSSLSGLPIAQNIAVTGSVNQLGEIQPIGGVNEKVEGFFDLCREAGKLGNVGVMAPKQNIDNLQLRHDVVEAVARGEFAVYAVGTIDEGITLLTGVEAGEPDDDGEYPEGTVNCLVARRLSELAHAMKDFAGT